MKLSTSLVILASVTGTMAGCFSGGQTWIDDCNKNSFKGGIRDLCNSGALSGNFQGHDAAKYACVQSRCNGIKADLEVRWTGGQGTWYLSPYDCELRLNNEMDGCWHGGESVTSSWFFK
jgi:hypothetical protein